MGEWCVQKPEIPMDLMLQQPKEEHLLIFFASTTWQRGVNLFFLKQFLPTAQMAQKGFTLLTGLE